MKCAYCETESINSTTKKELKVCCCYMLHKRNGEYIQHYRGSDVQTIRDSLMNGHPLPKPPKEEVKNEAL